MDVLGLAFFFQLLFFSLYLSAVIHFLCFPVLTNCNPYFHDLSVSVSGDTVNVEYINDALITVIEGLFL